MSPIRIFARSSLPGTALLAACLIAAPVVARPPLIERLITPSAADPAVKSYDDPSVAVSKAGLSPDAPLVIFLPGTGGRPVNTRELLGVIADQGYRALGVEYDDTPAVVGVCPRTADPDCSANFRRMRVDGSGPGAPGVVNSAAESITNRLVAALRALDRGAPGEGWGGYLDGNRPRWDRIVVSGLSQGAGMAAYIARQHMVRRVVLFSSPWDFTLPGRKLAPWIDGTGATPAARWFAEYHRREKTADLLAQSYRALRIPADHILVFDRDLPPGIGTRSPNPFHGSTVRDTGYAPQWRVLYGTPGDAVAP
ncbi:MAG: BPSS1187 family protein [Sphingomonas sp.]|uniref:BPSS1187 family protein n=1 Tax=Sphingomonas sp. TaxID=28214 RepID=UPI003F7CD533